MADEKETGRWTRRLGVYGDLPTRFLLGGLKVAPWFLEPVLVTAWTAIIFLLAAGQRRAVAGNLGAMFPRWGAVRRQTGAFRVFRNFAATYVDALRCETGTGEVDWRTPGEHWDRAVGSMKSGAIVLTAHMGNYDMAAPVFSEKFGRTVYAVRAPERDPRMQRIKEAELRAQERENPLFRTLYNEGGAMLGIELARLLGEGKVVAVQGDRVIFEVSPMRVEVEPGLVMAIPRGPLILAQMSKAPCLPIFILREGWRRYRIEVRPQLELPPGWRGDQGREAERRWARALLAVVRPHWDQWFVFEPVFSRVKGGTE